MIKDAYKRCYLKGAGAGAGNSAPGLRPGRNDGLLMVGLWPRDKPGIIQVMVGYSEEIKHRFTWNSKEATMPPLAQNNYHLGSRLPCFLKSKIKASCVCVKKEFAIGDLPVIAI